MEITIGELRKADGRKAIQYAITGMHFNWYLDNSFLLNLYGRYFWYLELSRATQVLAAYVDGEFAGVLLADIYSENKKYRSFWKSFYVKVFDVLQNTFYKGGVGVYEETTGAMLKEYKKTNTPDGELVFLAANPDRKAKGIGSALLSELERRESGKKLFLHTDDACTYEFYQHKGFDKAGEREIVLDMGKKKVPLKCFIFSKVLK